MINARDHATFFSAYIGVLLFALLTSCRSESPREAWVNGQTLNTTASSQSIPPAIGPDVSNEESSKVTAQDLPRISFRDRLEISVVNLWGDNRVIPTRRVVKSDGTIDSLMTPPVNAVGLTTNELAAALQKAYALRGFGRVSISVRIKALGEKW